MIAPGIHALSAELYHADPCPAPSLSSSIGALLIERSPLHAWTAHPRLNPNFEPKHKAAFDLGSAAHALMLGDPRDFEIVVADDWRTKVAKEKRDEARAAGKIPLLHEQWKAVTAMVIAGRRQLLHHEDGVHAFIPGIGKPEVTLIWQEGAAWLRARLDWLPEPLTAPYFEYKTTAASAEPDSFGRTLYGMGYDFQAAFYRRGLRALGLCADPQFQFVVQETEPPYALSVIGLPPAALDMAERKAEAAIGFWTWCMANKSWPGYPARTAYVDPPAWHESRWLDREMRDGLAREGGADAPYKAGLRAPILTDLAGG